MTGIELYEIRRRLNMGKLDFGRALGMMGSRATVHSEISRMESGRRPVTDRTALVARALVAPATGVRQ